MTVLSAFHPATSCISLFVPEKADAMLDAGELG